MIAIVERGVILLAKMYVFFNMHNFLFPRIKAEKNIIASDCDFDVELSFHLSGKETLLIRSILKNHYGKNITLEM